MHFQVDKHADRSRYEYDMLKTLQHNEKMPPPYHVVAWVRGERQMMNNNVFRDRNLNSSALEALNNATRYSGIVLERCIGAY